MKNIRTVFKGIKGAIRLLIIIFSIIFIGLIFLVIWIF